MKNYSITQNGYTIFESDTVLETIAYCNQLNYFDRHLCKLHDHRKGTTISGSAILTTNTENRIAI